jgi:hypothetical protein
MNPMAQESIPRSSRDRLLAPMTSRRCHGQREDHNNDAGSVRASIEGSGPPLILASKPRSR